MFFIPQLPITYPTGLLLSRSTVAIACMATLLGTSSLAWSQTPSNDKDIVLPPLILAKAMTVKSATLVETTSRFRLDGAVGLVHIDLPSMESEGANSVDPTTTPKEATSSTGEGAWNMADAVNAGLAFSPIIRATQAQFEVALNRKGQARSELFPTLSMRRAQGPEHTVPAGGVVDSHRYQSNSVRLSMALYNRNAWHAFVSSQKQESSAQMRLKGSEESVALSLVKATVDVATNRLQLRYGNEWIMQLGKVMTFIETRVQSGASSQADLERARTRFLGAKQTQLDIQAAYKSSLLEIRRLTGKTPSQLLLPSIEAMPSLPQTKDELVNRAMVVNFDLQALREEISAQESVVSSVQGRLMPVLGVSVESDRNANVQGTNPQVTNTRALIVASWTFGLGGKEFYATNETRAELLGLKAKLDAEKLKIEQFVEADFGLLTSAKLRIAAGESEQKAAQKVVDIVQEQMSVGRVGSALEMLDAFERLYNASARLVQARGQQMLAHANLLRITGDLSQIKNSPQKPPVTPEVSTAAEPSLKVVQ